MKKILLFLIACICTSWLSAQFVYKIKADSVLITNDSCTAELNLENSTRHVLGGFLYNKGNGRTEFRKVIKKVFNGSDSVYVIGEDTLQISGGLAKDGLIRYGNNLYLGDTSYGSNTHNFTANRYQYLNGKYYSFGGTKYDPNLRPALRIHSNGDITFGTNNNYSVIPWEKEGMRYIAKNGLLQIGLSDPIDTSWAQVNGSGILINSDVPNTRKGLIKGAVAAMYGSHTDSTAWLYYSFITGHNFYFDSNSVIGHGMMSGKYHYLAKNVQINSSNITGYTNSFNNSIYSNSVSGGYNVTQDISENSLISGIYNNYGGVSQLVTGSSHNAKSPMGTYLGNRSADFTSLTYTSNLGYNLPAISNLASYPVLSLGNSANGTTRSNALTIMYTGRTQINTKGFNNNLNESDVIPKAALEVVSSNSGVLLPKLTTSQINSILSGDLHSGLILYNLDSNRFQYYNGTAWKFIFNEGSLPGGPTQFKNIVIESPSASENLTYFYTDKAITITKVADVLRGGGSPSVTYNIRYATARDSGSPTNVFGSNRTVTTTSGGTTTSFSNASIPAGRWVWIVTSATSVTVNEISIAITYTEN